MRVGFAGQKSALHLPHPLLANEGRKERSGHTELTDLSKLVNNLKIEYTLLQASFPQCVERESIFFNTWMPDKSPRA